jgi:hypothetical protein
VDTAVISELKEAVGSEANLEYSTPEFPARAEAYDSVAIVEYFSNVIGIVLSRLVLNTNQ